MAKQTHHTTAKASSQRVGAPRGTLNIQLRLPKGVSAAFARRAVQRRLKFTLRSVVRQVVMDSVNEVENSMC